MSLPQLQNILAQVTANISPNGIAPNVQTAFNTARAGINQDFASAGRGNQAAITQGFAQGGQLWDSNQRADAMTLAANDLEKERRTAMRNLDFSEANAGLTQFNALMNLLGAGAGTGLNLAGGFSSAQSQAIGGLSNQSQGWSTLGGAASGAATGATFGPYGALIGGVLGGVGGYLGSQG